MIVSSCYRNMHELVPTLRIQWTWGYLFFFNVNTSLTGSLFFPSSSLTLKNSFMYVTNYSHGLVHILTQCFHKLRWNFREQRLSCGTASYTLVLTFDADHDKENVPQCSPHTPYILYINSIDSMHSTASVRLSPFPSVRKYCGNFASCRSRFRITCPPLIHYW